MRYRMQLSNSGRHVAWKEGIVWVTIFNLKRELADLKFRSSEGGLDSKFVSERQTEWCFVARTNRPALPPRGGISRNIVRLLEGGLVSMLQLCLSCA